MMALMSLINFICPFRSTFLSSEGDDRLESGCSREMKLPEPLLHSSSNITDCKLRVYNKMWREKTHDTVIKNYVLP